MSDAHCDRCATYEAHVMAGRAEGGDASPDVTPCGDYVMSERFKAWLVEAMRAEVLGHVSQAGLDRMAVLGSKEQGDEEE